LKAIKVFFTANKNRIQVISLVLFCLVLCAVFAVASDDEAAENREYKIKAAFIYNFIKAVEWPPEHLEDANAIVIGIIGRNPFGDAFKPVENKIVKDKHLVVRVFKGPSENNNEQSDEQKQMFDVVGVRECQVLFICSSEAGHIDDIITAVKEYPALTVSEVDGFLAAGGIINFVPGANQPVFDINLAASRKVGLTISSKLLRIASRVIDEEPESEK
jgi:hypothetical protein